MASGRYVVLGLAQARSPWFRSVAHWATSASLPVEFVKCVSVDELRSRLASGRPFSALLIDGGLTTVDRDLLDAARRAGTAVIVVDDSRVDRDWIALGADAVLLPVFDRSDLLDALQQHAERIDRRDAVPGTTTPDDSVGWRGPVAMVCGPGGTGTSTVAIALAQGLGEDVRNAGLVVLADLALRAEQAMLHDARDVVPGVQELVDAHRSDRPPVEDVRSLTFAVEARHYHLLLGLRRARAWASIRPRAFEASFDSLRRAFRVVVCDCDADLEGEIEGGSVDVEERNVMARTAAGDAAAVLAVGSPGMKGVHSLVRVVGELIGSGVPAARIVPVVNRAPRPPRARAELAAALAAMTAALPGGHELSGPVFLPERNVDDALRDGVRLPSAVVEPVVGAWRAVLGRQASPARPAAAPRKVVPGTLGTWAAEGTEPAAS
jgi:hypothetical protein